MSLKFNFTFSFQKENPGPKQKLCLATIGIQDSKDQSSQKTGKLNRKTQLKELKIQIVRTAIELEKQRIDIQENLKELIKFDKEAKERRNLMNSALKELRDKIETIEKDFQKWINMCIPENTKLKVCDPECKLEQLSQENEMVKSGKATRDEELERVEK